MRTCFVSFGPLQESGRFEETFTYFHDTLKAFSTLFTLIPIGICELYNYLHNTEMKTQSTSINFSDAIGSAIDN